MTVDAEKVRTLAAQREGTRIDFKAAQYNWAAEGNVELAKDLMAMANALGPHGANAYILIGVQEQSDGTGLLVGGPPSMHLNDADMHQKVHVLLNRTPEFSYAAVEVDGLSVGVFEIRPGNRPIFPNVTKGGRLVRGVARYRDGSSTADAWPDRIVEWFQEDHGDRLREAELEALRAQTAMRAVIKPGPISGDVWEFVVANGGMVPFTVIAVVANALPTDQLWRENRLEPPVELRRFPVKVTPLECGPVLLSDPGLRGRAEINPRELSRQLLGCVPPRSPPYWFDLEVRVQVESPSGKRVWFTDQRSHPNRAP